MSDGRPGNAAIYYFVNFCVKVYVSDIGENSHGERF